jgi:hypothetical protein
MFSLWMHMLLNDLLVAMVVVVMESNTYFQFSPPSVDTSIESSLSRIRWWGADRHYIVGVSAQVFGFDDLKREIVKEVGVCYSGLSVDIQ